MARKIRLALDLPIVARKRKSYEDRCGMASRAAKTLAKAITEKPVYTETEDGHRVRDWSQPHERLTNDELRVPLLRMRAVEEADLLEYVSPGVIKYAVQQKWLAKRDGLYWITAVAAKHLNLPGRDRFGVKINFLAA